MNYKDLFIVQSMCKKSVTDPSIGKRYDFELLNANTPKPSTTETEICKITPKISGAGTLDITGWAGTSGGTRTATIKIYENNTLIKTVTASISPSLNQFSFDFTYDFKAFCNYSVKAHISYVTADAEYLRIEFSGSIVDDENAYFNF